MATSRDEEIVALLFDVIDSMRLCSPGYTESESKEIYKQDIRRLANEYPSPEQMPNFPLFDKEQKENMENIWYSSLEELFRDMTNVEITECMKKALSTFYRERYVIPESLCRVSRIFRWEKQRNIKP